jgi:hypothetical protein
MSETAEKTDPELWERIKEQVTADDKGGDPGEWSARKAQFAVAEYKKAGGGYLGKKDPHNHLVEWTREDWGTKSGKDSGDTGERYLPKKVREALSDEEYRRTTAKKRAIPARASSFPRSPKMSRKRLPVCSTAARPRPSCWLRLASTPSRAAPQ